MRKIAQYFYPQRQTQVMNEGWATFWHHRLLNQMYDDGYLADGMMIEWLKSHTNVVAQPPVTSRNYSGINPYALGFAMYTDIKRICEKPTDEDRQWFPDFAGTPWLPTLDHAMRNFKDESFIGQYLSPKLMRDFRLFAIVDDDKDSRNSRSPPSTTRTATARLREALSRQYDLGSREPNIQVWNVNLRGDRSLTLAPHAAQRPAVARRLAGGAQARRAAVGLRRAPGKRQRRRRDHAPLAGGALEELRRYQLKILPGFMMLCGSSACLICRIIATAPVPASSTRKPCLCSPMPCSPVQVPPAAIARCTSW